MSGTFIAILCVVLIVVLYTAALIAHEFRRGKVLYYAHLWLLWVVCGQVCLLSMVCTLFAAAYRGENGDLAELYVLSDISTRVFLQLLIVAGVQLVLLNSSFCISECWLSMRTNNESRPVMTSNMFRVIHSFHAAAVLAMGAAQLGTNVEIFMVILQLTSASLMCVMTYVNAKCLIVLVRAPAASGLRNLQTNGGFLAVQRVCRLWLFISAAFSLLLILYMSLEVVRSKWCMGPVIRYIESPSSNLTRSDTTATLVQECVTISIAAFSWSLLLVAAIPMAKSTNIAIHPGAESLRPSPRISRRACTYASSRGKSQVIYCIAVPSHLMTLNTQYTHDPLIH
jgi:hypothetical protein